MANEVVVRYKAEVDDLTNKLNLVVEAQENVGKSAEETSKDVTKSVNEQKNAAQKRLDLLNKEKQVLAQLKADRAKAFDPEQIRKFDAAISKSQSNIQLLGKGFSGVGSTISSVLSEISVGVAGAFSVAAIINFGKMSVDAFLEAQQNAQKLEFAVTKINGDSQGGYQRLIEQSEKLQKITIFSDDSIQQAQTALATYGLTANQIEKLIPILADYASAQKISIVDASEQVAAGLQGQGREFQRLGIDIKATQTPLENLSKIQEGLAKFTGAAAEATKTYAGQLEVAKNKADDLEETLGERLAPIFVKLKTALLEATLGLLGFNKAEEQIAADTNTKVEKNFQDFADRVRKSGGDVKKAFEERLDALKTSNQKIQDEINKQNDLLDVNKSGKRSILDNNITRKQIEDNKKLIDLNNEKIKTIKEIIDRQNEQDAQDAKTLSRDELKLKSLGQLNALLEENKKISNTVGMSNVQIINEELDARKKLLDRRIADADLIQKIEAKDASNTILNANEVEKAFLTLNKARIQDNVDLENFIKSVRKSSVDDQKEAEDELTKFLEEQNKLRVDNTKTTAQKTNEIYVSLVDSIIGTWVRANKEQLQLEGQVVNELTTLFDGFFANQISNIESQKQATDDSFTDQEKQLKDSLDKRYISQKEYEDQTKELLKKRTDAEKEADKEVRRLKRQQAILDKANALFQIAINTAVNIAEHAELSPFYAALGAAQAAVVLAQPIPAYKKGSKNTGKSGMALVGEEGPEAVFMPSGSKVLPSEKTKKYSDVLDAMYDNRLESMILNKYITPALQEQQKRFESKRESTFAENISKSITYNSTNGSSLSSSDMERINSRGIKITNASAIAKEIANQLHSDLRRR